MVNTQKHSHSCCSKIFASKKTWFHAIFHKLKKDFINLEKDGILVKLCDGTSKISHGGIAITSGDNLSSHEIGGFRRCFSNGLICRTCLCSHEDIKTKMHESCFNLRSPEVHKYRVDSVTKDNNLVPVYGVRCKSPFQELQSFDAIQSLSPNKMHDILEGIIPTLLNTIIEQLHYTKILSNSALCENLRKFLFRKNESRNKLLS